MSAPDIGLCFFLKRPKNRDDKYRYVYLRITINGSTVECSTKMKCELVRWNADRKRARGQKEDAISLNNMLDAITARCRHIRTGLIDRNMTMSALAIKETLLGRDEEKVTLMSVFGTFIRKLHNKASAKICAPTTVQKYVMASVHVQNFLKAKFGCEDVLLKSLDYDFMEEYDLWLRMEKKCCSNTVSKYLSNVKTIIYYAIRKGFLRSNPFHGYKVKRSEVLIIPLSLKEMGSIAERELSVDRLRFVRDIFLFCCYTGLSYADVKQLGKEAIQDGFDQEQWLTLKRQKTGVVLRLPLLDEAKAIIKRYEHNELCIQNSNLLPVFSNQKTNEYLKEIAALCGISRRLTFHMARHTFATTVTLGNGVPIETVSKMLGHNSLRQTQYYARILDRKISEDMKLLKLRLSKEK